MQPLLSAQRDIYLMVMGVVIELLWLLQMYVIGRFLTSTWIVLNLNYDFLCTF